MNDKPSYVGLLNAIALAECRAAEYLNCWASVTPNPDVRALLHTVALREAEHGLVFQKRLDELGFGLVDNAEPDQQRKLDIAASTTLSDREKLEQLKLCEGPQNGRSDIFDRFFENKDIDPVTGGLLGRYIAEERDTGRRFAACHAALCEAESAAGAPRPSTAAPDLSALAGQMAAVSKQLAELAQCLGATAAAR